MKRSIAAALLRISYALAGLIGRLRRPARLPENPSSSPLLIIGTFYNIGWLKAHLRPLTQTEFPRVVLVTDHELAAMPGLEYRCPPPWLARLLSRAGAKFCIALWQGIKERPKVVMGYHIFPCAMIALIVGRLLGSATAYQVTGGQGEWIGGGFSMENPILSALEGPNPKVEGAAIELMNAFDWLIVRGSGTAAAARDAGFDGRISRIVGSVDAQQCDAATRRTDVLFVGRLEEVKRPDRVLRIASLCQENTSLHVQLVGDGILRAELEAQMRSEALSGVELVGKVADASPYYLDSRIFLLTSRSEGVSIAAIEAMAHGCVAVVSRVGDMEDLVEEGVTGYLLEQDDIAGYAERILYLLSNPEKLKLMSQAAIERAQAFASTESIVSIWNNEARMLNHPNDTEAQSCVE